jgi:hypothetical protein
MNIHRPGIRCPAIKFGAIVRFRCLPAVLALMAAASVWSPAGAFSGEMPERLIAQSVDERDRLTLAGNTRPETVALIDGSAGAVREAFQTEILNLNVSGQAHIGNVCNPKIPAALAPAVRYCGVDGCQKFHRRPGRNTRFTSICAPSYDLH